MIKTTTTDEIRKVVEGIEDSLVDIICSYIENKEIPLVKYEENNNGESLYINGELKCSHSKLYPLDILELLSDIGVIKIEK